MVIRDWILDIGYSVLEEVDGVEVWGMDREYLISRPRTARTGLNI
jgi:hypothetical protein